MQKELRKREALGSYGVEGGEGNGAADAIWHPLSSAEYSENILLELDTGHVFHELDERL
jgi:hypothetical protein